MSIKGIILPSVQKTFRFIVGDMTTVQKDATILVGPSNDSARGLGYAIKCPSGVGVFGVQKQIFLPQKTIIRSWEVVGMMKSDTTISAFISILTPDSLTSNMVGTCNLDATDDIVHKSGTLTAPFTIDNNVNIYMLLLQYVTTNGQNLQSLVYDINLKS